MSAIRRTKRIPMKPRPADRPGAAAAGFGPRERFFTLSLDMLCIAGFDGYFKQLNPAWERTLGFTITELTAKPFIEFVHPDDRGSTIREAQRLMAGAETVSFENRYLTKDGSYRWLSWTTAVSVEEQLYFAVARDITERRQAEGALRDSEERVRLIIDGAFDAFVGMDAGGVITGWNAQAETTFGWTKEEAVGRPVADTIIPPQYRDAHRRGLAHFLETGAGPVLNTRLEITALHRDGHEFPVELTITPIRLGSRHMFSAFVHDISRRTEAREAVRQAKDEADRANQAKSEFLSRMSHELRTPLNAILGFAQLLEMDSLSAEQRESVEHILKGGRHLLDLINEVLDIARIEEGRLAISVEPVSITEVVRESLDLVAPLAAAEDVRLTGGAAGVPTRFVMGDRQRLKQVLLNLLSNAVKYNRKGGLVSLSVEETAEGRVRIKVHDTGPGITPEKLKLVFTPFERLGIEQTGIEGTGLVLALSKRLGEAMGGTLGVESAVGRGSTFWVELSQTDSPVDRIERTGAPLPGKVDLDASKKAQIILYIEDNLSNLKLIQRLLAHRPEVRLVPAMQGRLGLDLAREHRPALILLDLHLPDIPGDEVLQRLQADPETRQIPVVVISADATPGQVDRLLAAGARAYLTKPLDVKTLLAVLERGELPGKPVAPDR
ncbi:MAG: PAS domain S-box protein [Bacillati bacterium ANGP1]|uniref:histidine kinase n=1 Tax=Candidatus Segetimicrobium genomatis TaxID=2569760 RepID=A0A537M1E7_9BACT|nr:MAG: PAS domain S-box protein [Terrabacteria group bacterium ANGP1]